MEDKKKTTKKKKSKKDIIPNTGRVVKTAKIINNKPTSKTAKELKLDKNTRKPKSFKSNKDNIDKPLSVGLYREPKNQKSSSKKITFDSIKNSKDGVILAHTKKADFNIGNLSSFGSHIGVNFDDNEFDSLDMYAMFMIELINSNLYSIGYLTKHEKFVLFRYFRRTNPVLGRIVDIHTEIPLSKMRLTPPKNCPEIMKDYVMQFYNKILDRVDFSIKLNTFVDAFWTYGESYVFVDDYFDFERDLQDIPELEKFVYDEDDGEGRLESIEKIEKDYAKNPELIDLEGRREYLRNKFPFFEEGYIGPSRIKLVPFYDINKYYSNEDIKFEAIKIKLDEQFINVMNNSGKDELLDMGYSEGFLKLFDQEFEDVDVSESEVLITNDYLEGIPFIFKLKRFESSILNRVFNICLQWDAAMRAFQTRLNQLGKIGRIISGEDISEEQLVTLVNEVALMVEDPNHAIVTNYRVDWNEVNGFVKDELKDLMDSTNELKDALTMSLGVPDSLLSGESQYSGSYIQLEVLNNQYFAFKVWVQEVLEDMFLKPIALRKGLITIDSWGNTILVHPSLTFSRMPLRSDNIFEMLYNLYLKNTIPVDIILDLLNIDAEDATRDVKRDLFTVKDPMFNRLLEDWYRVISDEIVNYVDVAPKIVKDLGFEPKEPKIEDVDTTRV